MHKYGLEAPLRLQRFFDYPDKAYPTVHVGGTNGKGSVCWKLARVCSNHYPKVGLFSSPHISSFRERMMINHTPISIERAELLFTQIFERLNKPGGGIDDLSGAVLKLEEKEEE